MYVPYLKRKVTHFSAQLSEAKHKEQVKIAGIITRFRPHLTKAGKHMGFVTIEDIQGSVDLVVFPEAWKKYRALVQVDQVLIASGRLDAESNEPKLLVDRLIPVRHDDVLDEMESYQDEALDEGSVAGGSSAAAPYPVEEGPQSGYQDWEPEAELQESINPEWHVDEDQALSMSSGIANYDDSAAVSLEQRFVGSESLHMIQEQADPKPVDAFRSPAPSLATSMGNLSVDTQVDLASSEPNIPDSTLPENLASMPFMVSPAGTSIVNEAEADKFRMLTAVLRSTGDKNRDIRRLNRAHGILHSCPGYDRFSFLIYENGHYFLMDFPNETTNLTTGMLQKLSELLGEENLRLEWVKPIT
jgi:DNA polymerase-3 subunit alpha